MSPIVSLGSSLPLAPLGPVELPDTLSALVRVALKDLLAVEAQPQKYTVEMSDWMVKDKQTGVCEVCLGGSVLAGTLGIDVSDGNVDEYGGPQYQSIDLFDLVHENKISEKTHNKLHALDYVRLGPDDLQFALEELHMCDIENSDIEVYLPDDLVFPDYEPYEIDAEVFKAYLAKLADNLEAVGL